MSEELLATGVVGAIVWLATDQRIILRHESAVPSPAPSPDHMRELEALGWRRWEIAHMYGTSLVTLERARKLSGEAFQRSRNNKRGS